MKKRIVLFLATMMILLMAGCGEKEETTTQATTEAVTEETKKSIGEIYGEELGKADQKYQDAIKDYTMIELDDQISGTITASSGGMMAEAADFTSSFLDSYENKYSKNYITVKYEDESGYTVTWDSEDGKTGYLMNTLTNYSEDNVTIDGLYSWKEGK